MGGRKTVVRGALAQHGRSDAAGCSSNKGCQALFLILLSLSPGAYVLSSAHLRCHHGKLTTLSDVLHQRVRAPRFKLVSEHRHHLQPLLRGLELRGFVERGTGGANWDKQELRSDQWDLLWSFGYTKFNMLGALTPLQRVNHLPGNSGFTIKAKLWETHQRIQTDMKRRGVVGEAFVPHQVGAVFVCVGPPGH